MNETKFTEVFDTMKDLSDVQEIFMDSAMAMSKTHSNYTVMYKTDVRISVDKNGKEVPELTCTLKVSKKNEVLNFL